MAKKKIRKAVIPAAGLGTRFLPATKAQPKEMLPIVDKPIIQYAVEEAIAGGIETVIIVTGRGKNAIENHFDAAPELESALGERGQKELAELVRDLSQMIDICYIRQKQQLGLGHAIWTARELVDNEPFAVLLADDIIEAETPCIRQLMDVFEETGGAVLAIEPVERAEVSRYGIVAGEPVGGHWLAARARHEWKDRLYRVHDLIEKPAVDEAPSNMAIIGRYVLTPEIFECLGKIQPGRLGEIQLTDGLRSYHAAQHPLFAYRFQGRRHDAGDKLGFLKTTVEFALKNSELGEAFRQYLKSLKL